MFFLRLEKINCAFCFFFGGEGGVGHISEFHDPCCDSHDAFFRCRKFPPIQVFQGLLNSTPFLEPFLRFWRGVFCPKESFEPIVVGGVKLGNS